MSQKSIQPENASIKALLSRNDIWRGYSQAKKKQRGIDTGYDLINNALHTQGWPQEGLIEICSPSTGFEWWLFHPAMHQVIERGAYIALVSPPYIPYSQGIAQLKLSLDRLIVITPQKKHDFIATLVELNRSPVFQQVMAWPQKFLLSYSELRKIHLAQKDGIGLSTIFRTLDYRKHSSPAALRLATQLHTENISLEIFKQQGQLKNHEISLPIPDYLQALPQHHVLDSRKAKDFDSKNIIENYSLSNRQHQFSKKVLTAHLTTTAIRAKKLKYEYQVQ